MAIGTFGRLGAGLCAVLLCGSTLSAGPVRYRLVDLGTLPGGDFSDGLGINNQGQAVGETTNADFDLRAFLWQNGSIRDLGTLGQNDSIAWDVNDRGQVVGQSESKLPGLPGRAFLLENGAMRDLGALLPDGFSTARALNNGGQVVGASQGGSGDLHAVMWENGAIRDLGVPSTEFNESEARDVNINGRIVGRARTPGHVESRAFIVQDGAMTVLPTLGGNQADAFGINDGGQVVGESDLAADGPTRAFLYDSATGQIRNLGTLGDNSSTAFDINNLGQVVGDAGSAFLWEDGTMLDLNDLIAPDSGWDLSVANGINDLGWIVGQGDNPDGEQRAFVLVPLEGPGPGPNPIPLPPSAWSGVIVMGGALILRGVSRLRGRRVTA